jgi:predicted amidophosphoribosyltransferase
MQILAALEELLLPNACVACDRLCEPSAAGALVCGRCRLRLKALTGGCLRCHQPLPLIGGCRFCAAWPAELRWARSGVWLGPEAREIVHHLKYEGCVPLAPFMAATVARALPPPAAGILVPVPLTPARLKHRGFNQAALLAHALGAIWQLPVRERLLTRRWDSGSQTALTPEQRLANVTGAFSALPPCHRAEEAGGADEAAAAATRARHGDGSAPPAAPATPPGGGGEGVVIIVDDVLTTGATLAAAATALSARGWRHLGAVTFARALPYEQRVV